MTRRPRRVASSQLRIGAGPGPGVCVRWCRTTRTLVPFGRPGEELGGVLGRVTTAYFKVNALARRVARVARVRDRRDRGDRNPQNCVPAETAATPPPIWACRNHRVLTRAGGSNTSGLKSLGLATAVESVCVNFLYG